MKRIRAAVRDHWRRYLISIWAVALIAALAMHFAMTLIYLTPDNPLRVRFAREINDYMNPYFSQRWSLFAPDLGRDDRRLYVQCRLSNDDGSLIDTPFQDVETFRLESKRSFKFTPEDRLHRITNAVPLAIFGESTEREKVDALLARHPEDERFQVLQKMFEAEQREQFEQGIHLASRVASAECDRMYGRGRTVATRVRIVMAKIPKFSERHRDDLEPASSVKLMWTPYEDVAPL